MSHAIVSTPVKEENEHDARAQDGRNFPGRPSRHRAPRELSDIDSGSRVDGYEVLHVIGRTPDFIVFTTTRGGIRWFTNADYAFDTSKNSAVESFQALYDRLRCVPVDDAESIMESLAECLFLALTDVNGVQMKFASVEAQVSACEIAAVSVEARRDRLRKEIEQGYLMIPDRLRHFPEVQRQCIEFLREAEEALSKRRGATLAEVALTNVKILIARTRSNSVSFLIVAFLIYAVAVLAFFGYKSGLITSKDTDGTLLVLGVPAPIWCWSVVGSATSMLLRAGQLPFANPNEAVRWVLFRPVVGIVMGVMTFLMVKAGLIVFAGSSQAKTPELLWIIAFAGAFSDTLSVALLERVLGRFKTTADEFWRTEGEGAAPETGDRGARSHSGRFGPTRASENHDGIEARLPTPRRGVEH
ncbi:MAG: hypothetical protein QM756_01835 [Polyangiaceae bacterium]